jgi:hypothetical protein
LSPTFFSHRVTVPSVTDSPKAGISTRCDIFLFPSDPPCERANSNS